MVVAQTSVQRFGVTPRQFETNSSIAREHVVALLEGTKLRLRARIIGSQRPDTGVALCPARSSSWPTGTAPPDWVATRRLRLPRRLGELVDGPLVTATDDPDASLGGNDVGAGVPSTSEPPPSVREHSAAARRRPIPSDCLLSGNVVLAGSTAAGDVDVPARCYRLLASAAQQP